MENKMGTEKISRLTDEPGTVCNQSQLMKSVARFGSPHFGHGKVSSSALVALCMGYPMKSLTSESFFQPFSFDISNPSHLMALSYD